jgi:Family of unknown function (DUF5519)
VEEVRGWEGVHLRPLFGWRGLMVGRHVFGCCHPREEPLLVWTKLPEPLWARAMATPLARPHPFNFARWLELRAATPDDLETILTWLHRAYEWVRSGEPPSWDVEEDLL